MNQKKPYYFGGIERLSSAELMQTVSSGGSSLGGVKRLSLAELVTVISIGGAVFGTERAEGEY